MVWCILRRLPHVALSVTVGHHQVSLMALLRVLELDADGSRGSVSPALQRMWLARQ